MNITPLDAWCFARLGAGHELNGHVASISEHFRPLAAHLNGLPVDQRSEALNGHAPIAWGQDGADALTMAMANADPDGPEPAAEAPEPWGPLRIDETPAVEPFPVDVLPAAVADLVREGALAIGCSPDLLALPVLVVAGGTIGRSVSLLLKHGYFASSAIYGATIGTPSDGKSPALAAAADSLRRIDQALALAHGLAMDRYKIECEAVGPDGKKKPGAMPKPPRPKRIDVDDTTIEALIGLLSDNPRGLVMVRDELSAFALGMNQYKAGGKGNDKPVILKIWSGQSTQRDRVSNENHEPIRCPHPSLSIIGGLTPDLLGELRDPKGRSDGFMDRFLFAYPDAMPSPDWSARGIPPDVATGWAEVIERIWARQLNNKDAVLVPHVARMTPRGQAAWEAGYNAHSAEMNDPGFPPSLRGPWGKLREYAGRLALVLALLHHAADPTADPQDVPDVDERRVEDAWRLVAYFKSHARRVYAVADAGVAGHESAAVKAITEWLLKDKSRATFTEREVKRARKWIKPETLSKALSHLTVVNLIRPQAKPKAAPKMGRSSLAYDVNPALHSPVPDQP